MRLPHAVTFIDKKQLKSLVKDVIKIFQIREGIIDVSKEHLKRILYDLCIYELKRHRWFYKKLNNSLLLDLMEEITKGLTFKDELEKTPYKKKDLFKKLDELSWKKVHHKPIDEKEYRRLQKEAEAEGGLQSRD